MKSLLLLLICPLFCLSQTVDQTLIETASGSDVVDAVVQKIRHSGIFMDDYNLLRRLAHTRSGFGATLPATGGIWDVSQAIFDQTKTSITVEMTQLINSKFGISWSTLVYTEVRKPLISGLTISVYLAIVRIDAGGITRPLQDLVLGQGGFLQTHGLITDLNQFVLDSWSMESAICQNPLDLTVILGGSVARTSTFEVTTRNEADFANQLFQRFSPISTRFGLITLSETNEILTPIRLDDPFNEAEIPIITGSTRPSTAQPTTTFINSELKVAVDMIRNSVNRTGVPKIIVVFSNAESSEVGGVTNVALARVEGINSVAVSIGYPLVNSVHSQQFTQLTQGLPENKFATYEMGADGGNYVRGLGWLHLRLAPQLCNLHQLLTLGQIENGILGSMATRYFAINVQIPEEGTVDEPAYIVVLNNTSQVEGSLVGSISYTEEHPSTAIYDIQGGIGETKVPLEPAGGLGSGKIYIRVQNMNGTHESDFSIAIRLGTVGQVDVSSTTQSGEVEDTTQVDVSSTTQSGEVEDTTQVDVSSTTQSGEVEDTTQGGGAGSFVCHSVTLILGLVSMVYFN